MKTGAIRCNVRQRVVKVFQVLNSYTAVYCSLKLGFVTFHQHTWRLGSSRYCDHTLPVHLKPSKMTSWLPTKQIYNTRGIRRKCHQWTRNTEWVSRNQTRSVCGKRKQETSAPCTRRARLPRSVGSVRHPWELGAQHVDMWSRKRPVAGWGAGHSPLVLENRQHGLLPEAKQRIWTERRALSPPTWRWVVSSHENKWNSYTIKRMYTLQRDGHKVQTPRSHWVSEENQ